MLFTEQCGLRKEISTEDAAFRLSDSVVKSINQKSVLEKFSIICQRLFIA